MSGTWPIVAFSGLLGPVGCTGNVAPLGVGKPTNIGQLGLRVQRLKKTRTRIQTCVGNQESTDITDVMSSCSRASTSTYHLLDYLHQSTHRHWQSYLQQTACCPRRLRTHPLGASSCRLPGSTCLQPHHRTAGMPQAWHSPRLHRWNSRPPPVHKAALSARPFQTFELSQVKLSQRQTPSHPAPLQIRPVWIPRRAV